MSCLRAASSSVNVPTMLVWMNGLGSSSELSLCDSAAKWTTASWLATSGSTSVGVGDVADDQLDPVLGQPVERLAAGGVGQLVEHRDRASVWRTTWCTKLEPMKPAPPVTRRRSMPRSLGGGAGASQLSWVPERRVVERRHTVPARGPAGDSALGQASTLVALGEAAR